MRSLTTVLTVTTALAGFSASTASAHPAPVRAHRAVTRHHVAAKRCPVRRAHGRQDKRNCRTALRARLASIARSGSRGPTTHPGVVLNASFNCDCISKTMFPYQSFVGHHVTVVPDPLGGTQNVLKFAVPDSDRPYQGASSPRADIETSPSFKPGDDDYIAVHTLVPTTMPAVDTNKAWFELAEIYGQPYNGSPPVSVALSDWNENGQNHFIMNQDASHGYQRAWTGPAATDGKWHTIIFHVHFATDNSGSVQIYFDGQLQTMTNGTTTLHEATLDPGVNWDGTHGNFLNIQSYRSPGSFPGTVTNYMGAPKIGTTLASVA